MPEMNPMYVVEGILRWTHVVAGILWIGLLYFFNFVNANFAPTMDGDTKKKVVPQLMPRALFFFRWGAAYTWVTGLLVIMMTYYHGKLAFEGGESNWTPATFLLILLVFGGFFIYDQLVSRVIKNPQHLFFVGWFLASVMGHALWYGGFSFRGYAIHVGAMFGTIMAANVWMRIWPAQRKIITAIKNGEKPDDAMVALAGSRSKHNTYLSVPLVFMMISKSMTWAAHPGMISLVILIGFFVAYKLYDIAKKVPGF